MSLISELDNLIEQDISSDEKQIAEKLLDDAQWIAEKSIAAQKNFSEYIKGDSRNFQAAKKFVEEMKLVSKTMEKDVNRLDTGKY